MCVAADGGFDLDGHGVFRHVLLAPGHPGLALPAELADDARVVHAYEPHEYASQRGDRRRRDGGCDGMAERARGRSGGRLGAPARARAAPAQRRPAALHEAWPLLVPRDRRSRARRALAPLQPAVLPARPSLGRAAPEGRAGGALPGRAGSERFAERHRAGDLRDGLPARLRARPSARAPRRRARARDRGRLDRPRRRFDRPRAHRRDADARPVRCLRASGPSLRQTRSWG